jgi:hypothetical protein
MCNDYEQHVRWAEYCAMMEALELGIPTQQTELDLPQADDIKINDMGPVMRAAGNGIELVSMNFSFLPSGPRGGPVFNFRSDGRRFDKSNRCLIPASAFFEFTGKKYPKAKHRFALKDSAITERGEQSVFRLVDENVAVGQVQNARAAMLAGSRADRSSGPWAACSAPGSWGMPRAAITKPLVNATTTSSIAYLAEPKRPVRSRSSRCFAPWRDRSHDRGGCSGWQPSRS